MSASSIIAAMRQIVLDTETTGLSAEGGDRIIEIGCVELVARKLTGNNKHWYLNPERDSHEDALKVHGISNEFLRDKPKFAAVADELMAYVAGAEIIIHNAAFDVGFLNKELELLGRQAVHRAASCRQRHRHAGDGQGDVPRQAQQPGRAVRPPGRGQLRPHAARRAARRRAAGRRVHQPHARPGRPADRRGAGQDAGRPWRRCAWT
jgi:hypothetical protein